MKRVKFLLVGVLVTLLLTGCGSKELNCTKTTEEGGMKVNEKITTAFDGDELAKVEVGLDYEIIDETIKTYFTDFVRMLDQQFKGLNKDGLEITTASDPSKYTYNLSMNVDFSKLKSEDLDDLGIDSLEDIGNNYDDVKKSAEDNGYTCK